jgi:hypothetical protein
MKTHILLFAAATLAACGTTPRNLDAQMGDSVRIVKAQQTLNPAASADPRPVTALDGSAADAIVDRYRKSFAAPPPPTNVFNIGVSSGGK